jgi:DNA-nicking Smr family endonuclease
MKPQKLKSFYELKRLSRELQKTTIPKEDKPAPTSVPQYLSDSQLFQASMEDVTPLGWSADSTLSREPVEIANPGQTEDEGLRLLNAFMEGKIPIDLTVSGEYVEGAPSPEGKKWLDSLRSGRFAVEAHCDLHGLTILDARQLLEKFIRRSLQKGFGCIRLVHGRGHHSPNDPPILKEQLQRWLCSRRMSRYVVAYTSARMHDGGGGALYVLLHRHR